MDPFVTSIVAVLAFSLGIFASHATLGNKITRLATQLEPIPESLKLLETRVTDIERTNYHVHRRASDTA